jgi:hypothetical protein
MKEESSVLFLLVSFDEGGNLMRLEIGALSILKKNSIGRRNSAVNIDTITVMLRTSCGVGYGSR